MDEKRRNKKVKTVKDPLGDELKQFEKAAETYPTGLCPIVIRLDGKNFSKYTKKIGCIKPYDKDLSDIMKTVTLVLVEYCNADIGYTQSDEITLVLTKKHENAEMFYGGRFQKLCSVLASVATYHFNKLAPQDIMALFDCRVFEVPDKSYAIKCLEWRALDCRRNSVSCYAQCNFSHKELQGKKTFEMREMLEKIDKNWRDMPEAYRNGIYIKRKRVMKPFTTMEISTLPEKHQARTNPDLKIERSVIEVITTSILDTHKKLEFVF